MKILEWDVESLPAVSMHWQFWDTNIPHKNIIEHQSLICIAWKWHGEKRTYITSILDDPKRLKKDLYDDYYVTKTFRDVLMSEESFVMMGHNLKGFDVKKFNTSCIRHGFSPVPDRQIIDTLTVCRRHFKFESNTLAYVCKALDVGGKMETGGQELWNNIVQYKYPPVGHSPDRELMIKSLEKMGKYCKQDTRLLDPLYERLKPFMLIHPNASIYDGVEGGCIRCGSLFVKKYGFRVLTTKKFQRFFCYLCKAPFDPPAGLRKFYPL